MSMSEVLRGIGRSLIAVAPQKGDHRVAIRAAICTAVPLLVLWSLDRLDLRMYVSFSVFSALYGRFDAYPDAVRMQVAAGATLVAAMLVGTALAVLDVPTVLCVTVVALVAVLVTLIAQTFRWNPPGALFAVIASGATATRPVTALAFGDVLVVGGGSALFCVAVTVAFAFARRGPHAAGAMRPRVTLNRDAAVFAITVGAGTLLAGLTALARDSTHWFWAMIATVAALGGAHVTARVVLGLQRLAGTLGGVLIVAGLLALHLPPLVSILVVALCMAGAQLFVNRNYGIAVLFITSVALLTIELAVPADPAQLLRDRVVDSVIGVAIGIAVAVLSVWLRRRGDDSEKMGSETI